MEGDELSLRLFAADNNISYLFNSRNITGPLTAEPTLTVGVATIPEPRGIALFVAAFVMLWVVQISRRRNGLFH